MRIAVDLLPMQAKGSRTRGVGRLATELLRHLLRRGAHHYVLLRHASYPWPEGIDAAAAKVFTLDAPPRDDFHGVHPVLQRLVDEDALQLDFYLNLNPFEASPCHDLPRRSLGRTRMVAFVHDLIPLGDPERYLANPDDADWYRARCRTIKGYDLVLTNSEATRSDCLVRLGLDQARVLTVGAGVDRDRFRPVIASVEAEEDEARLRQLGICGPFFFHLGGMDERKNMRGVVEALGLWEKASNEPPVLVVAGAYEDAYRRRVLDELRGAGGVGRLLWAGRVDDRTLVALYRRCLAFVLVSKAEGFGLPLLEAMACGAPVIAGNDPAQSEVVGQAGLRVQPEDLGRLAAILQRLASEADWRASLSARSLEQAGRFSWEGVAERVSEALACVGHDGVRTRGGGGKVRRLAMFSPFPNKGSGIADHAIRLARALARDFALDLYHDADYVPEAQYREPRLSFHDHRVFERRRKLAGYRGCIYHMGNSWYHRYLYETALEQPGILVLHDLHLAGFQWWLASLSGNPEETFDSEIRRDDPASASRWRAERALWKKEEGSIQGAAARRGLFLNRRLLERSPRVLVHSRWAVEALSARHPDLAERFLTVPLGAEPIEVDGARVVETRQRLGLGPADVLIGVFGILTRNKMDEELLEAFSRVATDLPGASLVFVGKDWEEGAARRKAEQLGILGRTRFLGRVELDQYEAMLGAVDIAVSLRRPPTFGETSASLLDALRAGRPTIFNDAGTFGEVPSEVGLKLHWESEGIEGLARAIRLLATDPVLRLELGKRASQYIRREHSWARVVALYEQVIEDEWKRRRDRRMPLGGGGAAVTPAFYPVRSQA